jgi:hypothetical protein
MDRDSTTRRFTVEVVARSGTVPVAPPPAHDTDHVTVARNRATNDPDDVFVDSGRYVCPHVGEGACGSIPVRHAVPAPLHTSTSPSP